jgi:hypothetical protein
MTEDVRNAISDLSCSLLGVNTIIKVITKIVSAHTA